MMSRMISYLLFLPLSYLVGAIPVALLVARLKGVDIRKVGSGNIGATNVFRCVSKPLGVLTFMGDAVKGFVPAFCFPLLSQNYLGTEPSVLLGLLCGCAAIAGHNWSIFIGFKGGKGVSTSAGMLLGIAPVAMLIGLAVWAVVVTASRCVSLASISAAAAVPVAAWFLYRDEGWLLPVALTLLGILVIFKHRANIRRLLRGEEHRFGKKKDSGST